MYDVLVVGGGPAGCQAAISAVTEGFKTALLESGTIGGQISASPHLENMAGYVYGVTGSSFGRNLEDQMHRLGVHVLRTRARGLTKLMGGAFSVDADDEALGARSVVIATGQRFRDLKLQGTAECLEYGPRSAFAWGPRAEGKTVAVVGGGNSAGQTIEYLGRRAARVIVVCSELKTSEYLTRDITAMPQVEIHSCRLVDVEEEPDGRCTVITDEGRFEHVDRVFVCAGVTPNTEWVSGSGVEMNDRGFVVTNERFETNVPGVFAVGDCRDGSVGRVPAALGEGAGVQGALWTYLNGKETD